MIDKYNEAGISTLERTGNATAKPATECIYPKCEECDKYHGHYCTVPIVVTKQMHKLLNERLSILFDKVRSLEYLIEDQILDLTEQTKSDPNAELNYTWADYFKEQE